MSLMQARPRHEHHVILGDDSDFILMTLCMHPQLNVSVRFQHATFTNLALSHWVQQCAITAEQSAQATDAQSASEQVSAVGAPRPSITPASTEGAGSSPSQSASASIQALPSSTAAQLPLPTAPYGNSAGASARAELVTETVILNQAAARTRMTGSPSSPSGTASSMLHCVRLSKWSVPAVACDQWSTLQTKGGINQILEN